MLPRPQRLIGVIAACASGLLIGLGGVAALARPAVGQTAGTPALVRIGSAPELPAGTQPLAAAASVTQRLRVTVALAPRDPPALTAYAEAVGDPGSADYRRYLSPGEFAARFGPSAATISRVQTALRRAGLKPRGLQANHLSLHLVATASAYERAFHLELAHVRLPDRRTVLVNLQAPALAAPVAAGIQAIVGLDGMATMRSDRARPGAQGVSLNSHSATATTHLRATRQIPEACAAARGVAGQEGAYTADQIASAYGFDGLYAAGDDGAGVSVGVYELEPDATSDIAAYQACYGTATAISYTQVDGGSGYGAGSGEAAFDIEQIIGLAPRAHLVVYQGPNSNSDAPGSGPYDIFATMISQDRVSIISNSWGECEAEEGASAAAAENTLFEEAAIQGQSVLSAAGDEGSEDCDGARTDGADTLAVDDPGSQPFVTDVGGTSMTALGPPPIQSTWNSGGSLPVFDPDAGTGAGAGGGGISSLWTMPAYQSAAPPSLNVVNADSSPAPCGSTGECREVPDVSADADPAHGYLIYYNGQHSVAGESGGWQASGGTSGAAPLWAAVFAEANADPACASGPLGFANPALYRAAASSQSTSFGDVSSGGNDFSGAEHGLYPATPGYDMATGLGSPDVSALAGELCEEGLRVTAPASLQSFVRSPQTLSVRTADPGQRVTVTVAGLPSGASFDPVTGLISGRPTVAGHHIVVVRAHDGSGAVRSMRFLWTVADRARLSRVGLTGAGAGTPVLTLGLRAGRAEAPLSAFSVTLPGGMGLVQRAGLSVTARSDGTAIRAALRGSGRSVKVTLRRSATSVVLRFGAGVLTEAGTVRAAARRVIKPTYRVSVVVRDRAGAVSRLHGSARVST